MSLEIMILRFVCLLLMCFWCLAQQVLTHVLEEAGYTKESLLVMSDFVKVPLPLYLIFLVFQHWNSFILVWVIYNADVNFGMFLQCAFTQTIMEMSSTGLALTKLLRQKHREGASLNDRVVLKSVIHTWWIYFSIF